MEKQNEMMSMHTDWVQTKNVWCMIWNITYDAYIDINITVWMLQTNLEIWKICNLDKTNQTYSLYSAIDLTSTQEE